MKRNVFPYALSRLVGCAFLTLVASLEGAVVVSNLSESNDGYPYGVNSTTFWANSFTTDGSTYQLNSATISIRSVEDASGGFQLSIWNGATAPGSEVAALSGSANPGAGLNTFTAAALTLTPNTRYWVVAKVVGTSGAYQWNTTKSLNQSGAWEIGNQPYYYLDLDGFREWTVNDDPYQFSVDASAVPEPSLALVMTSSCLLVFAVLQTRVRRLRGTARATPIAAMEHPHAIALSAERQAC